MPGFDPDAFRAEQRRGDTSARRADTPADPAAILAGIRERATTASTYDTWHLVGRDVSRLLAAVEATLKLADEWDAEAWKSFATSAALSEPARKARVLREAITSALTGQERNSND